jgi:cobalamin synthase
MYWQGPELKKNVDAGKYEILVQSNEKNIRYVLAIGETEAWNGIDGIKAILLIPELKRNFFEESPISFIFSPLGYGYILLLQLLALTVGLVILRILKISVIQTQKNYIQKFAKTNIFLGVVFWVSLLFLAVTTTWHPILILMSGFALFVTIISWRELKIPEQNKA